MRKLKKFIVIIMMLTLISGLVPNINISETYAITQNEVTTSLSNLINQYTGTIWNRSYAGGTQCYGFAHFVFDTIFGRGEKQVGNGAVSSNATCYKLNNVANDINTIGILAEGYSTSSLEALLESASPGDYLQVKRRTSGGPHSMIIVSVDAINNTIEIFDANSDGIGTVKHYTQSFTDFYNKNCGASVYRYSGYTTSTIPPSFTVALEDNTTVSGELAIGGTVSDGGTYPWLTLYVDYAEVANTANNEYGNYRFTLDTTKYSDGNHQIGIKLRNEDGYDYTQWFTLNFNNYPFRSYMDTLKKPTISGMDGTLRIRGWAVDKSGVESVTYAIHGGKSGECIRENRTDVAEKFPGYPTGSEGFYIDIPYGEIAYNNTYPEQVTIVLYAQCGDGTSQYIADIVVSRTMPETTAPIISDVKITDISDNGYTISAKVSDASGIDRVQFPTWTTANGQDDIQDNWLTNQGCSGTIENGVVTYRVNTSEHNLEIGEYITHIYAYDTYGNLASTEVKQNVLTSVNTYAINYNVNGGNVSAPAQQEKVENNNITIANYTGKKNKSIILHANGGTFEANTSTIEATMEMDFLAWNTKQDGSGTGYTAGSTYSQNTALTLYAQYTANGMITSKLPVPTREGYTFLGWTTNSDGTGVTVTENSYINSNITAIYAQWELVVTQTPSPDISEAPQPNSSEKPSTTPANPDDTETPGETPENPSDSETPSENPDKNEGEVVKDKSFYDVDEDGSIALTDAQKILRKALLLDESKITYTLADAQKCLRLALLLDTL